MNKKLKNIIILFIFVIFLSGCDISEGDIKEKISAPININPPIEGKWKITQRLDNKEESLDEEDKNIGSEGLFRKEALIIGKDYSTNPSFRIKNVKSNDYFLYKYKKDYRKLGIEEDRVQVITILNEEQYFFDLIKVNEDKVVIFKDDNFYSMEKINDEVSLDEVQRYISMEKTLEETANNDSKKDIETGVLLGIKVPKYDNNNDLSDWDYKTLWINLKNKKIENEVVVDNLFVPRKNGFWNITVDRKEKGNFVIDDVNINSNNKSKTKDKNEEANRVLDLIDNRFFKEDAILKNILFVSNDYMSIEKIILDEDEKRLLETYALDNVEEKRPVKLSDILGEDGKEIYLEGVESVVEVNEDTTINERNIALFRKDGYWMFKGRVNYIEKEKELYKDFNIKAIPPEEVVKYDKLFLPWDKIKSRVPNAEDVFSSPNEDFIIAKVEDKLIFYEIKNKKINIEDPIYEYNLPKNVQIVMSEWSTGRYAKLWDDEILKYKKTLE